MSKRSPSRELAQLSSDLGSLDLEPPEDQRGAEGLANGVKPPTSAKSLEDDELERFRREWRSEVLAKRGKGGEVVPGKKANGVQEDIGSEQGLGNGTDKATMTIPTIERSPIRGAQRLENGRSDAGPSTTSKLSPTKAHRSLSPVTSRPSATPHEPLRSPQQTANPLRSPPVYHKPHTKPTQPRPYPQPQSSQDHVPVQSPARAARAAHTQKRGETAVQLYARAVENEQAGKLNDALMLYRRAFKLDDAVDRAYQRQLNQAREMQDEQDQLDDIPSSTDIVSAAVPSDEPYSFQRHIQLQPDYEKTQPLKPTRISPLSSILQSLPVSVSQTTFQPAEEKLPLPLARLPPELLEPIFAHLDVRSIERFALTCWRARYLTAHSSVWRRIVQFLYKPPIIDVEELGNLVQKHGKEWRTVLIEEERVRFDGCYISVCHYVRPGAGDEWVAVTHMITYHRFLRFYPDGTVLSFLTTDHPSEVVPLLRPSLRGKGLHFGRWHLDRSLDPDGVKRSRIIITDLLEPGSEVPKYEFEMELSLRETQRGRWNKLDILNYQSINLASGETLALSLKHQKPFYFSKVKSYNPPL